MVVHTNHSNFVQVGKPREGQGSRGDKSIPSTEFYGQWVPPEFKVYRMIFDEPSCVKFVGFKDEEGGCNHAVLGCFSSII